MIMKKREQIKKVRKWRGIFMRDRSTGTAAASSMAISAYSARLQSRRSSRSLGISAFQHLNIPAPSDRRGLDPLSETASLDLSTTELVWSGRDGLPYLATGSWQLASVNWPQLAPACLPARYYIIAGLMC